jgi:hypothetical protein
MQRAAMRALLIPTYGLAGFGTMAAYMHFVTGAIAGFEGIAKGKYFLGPLLSLLCVVGAFALWRVWSIGGRIWRYGAYLHASPRDHRYDRAGVIAAGATFIGFVAIASAIYRVEEVAVYSILLMPVTCLAIVTFLWITSDPSPAPVGINESADDILYAAGLELADLPGLVCAIALGLFGVYRYVPLPFSGWGQCDWTIFYPLTSGAWPYDRSEIRDACSESVSTLSAIGGMLSLVCLIAGALAAVVGRNANARRGMWAAGIVVAVVLVRLAIQRVEETPARDVGWVESVIAGVLFVIGAAWVGYVGGKRGVELSRWLFGRTSSIEQRHAA